MDVFDRLLEELIHLSEDFVYGVGFWMQCTNYEKEKVSSFQGLHTLQQHTLSNLLFLLPKKLVYLGLTRLYFLVCSLYSRK
jgi:hypothetical protein